MTINHQYPVRIHHLPDTVYHRYQNVRQLQRRRFRFKLNSSHPRGGHHTKNFNTVKAGSTHAASIGLRKPTKPTKQLQSLHSDNLIICNKKASKYRPGPAYEYCLLKVVSYVY